MLGRSGKAPHQRQGLPSIPVLGKHPLCTRHRSGLHREQAGSYVPSACVKGSQHARPLVTEGKAAAADAHKVGNPLLFTQETEGRDVGDAHPHSPQRFALSFRSVLSTSSCQTHVEEEGRWLWRIHGAHGTSTQDSQRAARAERQSWAPRGEQEGQRRTRRLT